MYSVSMYFLVSKSNQHSKNLCIIVNRCELTFNCEFISYIDNILEA